VREDGYTKFWWGNLREKHHFADRGVVGRILLKWIFKNGLWGIKWIDPARDRERWRALVKVVIKVQVP